MIFFLEFYVFFFKLSFRQGNFSPCTGCPTFNIITGVDFNFGELCLTTQTPYCTSNNVTSSTTSLGQGPPRKGALYLDPEVLRCPKFPMTQKNTPYLVASPYQFLSNNLVKEYLNILFYNDTRVISKQFYPL